MSYAVQENQPSADAIQEATVRTSIALGTTTLTGLSPAWSAAGLDIREALATGGRSISAHRRFWAGGGFMLSQVQ